MDPMSDEILNKIEKIKRDRRNVPDPDYWRRLNPECSITDHPFPDSPVPYAISAVEMERNVEQMRKEGYFQTSPIIDPVEIDRLRRCITTVVNHGHRATYALVYDDFYVVMSKLANVLTPLLGPNFQLVPDEYEAYYIPTDNTATGTSPHRDSLRVSRSLEPDGTPTLVNVWIPLTDATTLNSSMYVLPAHRDPHYPHGLPEPADGLGSPDDINLSTEDIQSIRALPAKAGSVLCWSVHLLHWGARSSDYATQPRISFAMYYQSRHVPAYHAVTMDIPSPLPFSYRLRLIEKVWRKRERD